MTQIRYKLLIPIALLFVLGASVAQATSDGPTVLTKQLVEVAEKSADAAEKSAQAAAISVLAAQAKVRVDPAPLMLYLVPILVFLGSLLSIYLIRRALIPTQWSFADALSEEVRLPYFEVTTDANEITTKVAKFNAAGKPILIPKMRASASRVIAMMGMVVLLLMFTGFGTFALFSFGANGSLPSGIDGVIDFLLSGMVLFAPYAVNKFASVFKGIAGNK